MDRLRANSSGTMLFRKPNAPITASEKKPACSGDQDSGCSRSKPTESSTREMGPGARPPAGAGGQCSSACSSDMQAAI